MVKLMGLLSRWCDMMWYIFSKWQIRRNVGCYTWQIRFLFPKTLGKLGGLKMGCWWIWHFLLDGQESVVSDIFSWLSCGFPLHFTTWRILFLLGSPSPMYGLQRQYDEMVGHRLWSLQLEWCHPMDRKDCGNEDSASNKRTWQTIMTRASCW